MADEKISQLDPVTDVADADDYVLARAGQSNRITGASLKAAFNGGSSPPLYVRLAIRGGLHSDSGADVPSPISGSFGTLNNVDGMAYTGPTIKQAGGIGSFWVIPPVLPDGATLVLNYAEFRLSNADASEMMRIEYDGAGIPLVDQQVSYYLPFADCSVAGSVGDDLTLVSHTDGGVPDTAGIQTAAGGAFFQELLVTLIYTPPT